MYFITNFILLTSFVAEAFEETIKHTGDHYIIFSIYLVMSIKIATMSFSKV